jgi:hypothetical protein
VKFRRNIFKLACIVDHQQIAERGQQEQLAVFDTPGLSSSPIITKKSAYQPTQNDFPTSLAFSMRSTHCVGFWHNAL